MTLIHVILKQNGTVIFVDVVLKVQQCTVKLMEKLEEKKCLHRLRSPQPEATSAIPGSIVDAPVYVANPQYGPHMLLCVGVNQQLPVLYTHPDPEEVLLLNDGRQTRSLILVLSHLSISELESKAVSGTLLADDLVAMEMVFNDPALSFFTMLPGTPHCEVTLDEPGDPPYFFVTESRDLPSQEVNLSGITLHVSR